VPRHKCVGVMTGKIMTRPIQPVRSFPCGCGDHVGTACEPVVPHAVRSGTPLWGLSRLMHCPENSSVQRRTACGTPGNRADYSVTPPLLISTRYPKHVAPESHSKALRGYPCVVIAMTPQTARRMALKSIQGMSGGYPHSRPQVVASPHGDRAFWQSSQEVAAP
jgi:hypothetical protein